MSELTTTEKVRRILRGGEFIVSESTGADTFIPEEANEEMQMVRQSVKDFAETHIYPNYKKIENQENDIAKSLLQTAGEMGIICAHIPEEYGGMPLDTNTNTIIAEEIGRTGSFSVSVAAHTGIGMLPIFYYGTEEQKKKYLPGLCSGQLVAAYCLTEPASGSDALAARTRAVLSEDGKHYLVTGQKMWITNSGFADLFIVFAKIDGKDFTGFLVERGSEGLTLGAEEDKMGIKGSSTRQVFFENVRVPVENVLGEIGKGHHIAFNVLNIGRFKLGVMALGAAKRNANLAIQYALERQQFGTPIASFGAIQYKIAEQALRMYVSESALFRVSQLLQDKATTLFRNESRTYANAKIEAAEEYAIECAMMKVWASEMLDYVVDETVQIHGGNGFSEEYAAARSYRDARINRIFEGTNEINRLLSINMLMKRVMKGELDMVGAAWAVQKELAGPPTMGGAAQQGAWGKERELVQNLKKTFLLAAGAAAKWQMDGKLDLKNEQEIVINLADILMEVFAAESTLLRVEKLQALGKPTTLPGAILETFLSDSVARVAKFAQDALCSFAEGDVLQTLLMGIRRFCKYKPVNVRNHRRAIAAQVLSDGSYLL